MLSARFGVFRRAERCIALARLARPRALTWTSRPLTRPCFPQPLRRFYFDRPFATAVDAARPADEAERGTASPLENGECSSRAATRASRDRAPEPQYELDRILHEAMEADQGRPQSVGNFPPGVFEPVGGARRSNPFERTHDEPASGDAFEKALEGFREEGLQSAPAQASEAAVDTTAPMRCDGPAISGSACADQGGQEHTFPVLKLPTDPAQLKALPTGFHEMSEREQQEELWVVHLEARLGREWYLPDAGKHVPYRNDYPPYSPSKIIGMLHRWRNRAWSPEKWRLARAIAGNRSLRLPVLTAQAWLRRHNLLARRRGVALKMERYLGGTDEWKLRLAELEQQTGITEADIKQWLWILSPRDGDVQIQRFLRSTCRKPLFLLHLLVAKDRKIQEPATFLGLLRYIRENYVFADRPEDELSHPAYQGQGRSMTWWHFLVFLYRLVWHCREGWPAAMPLLARLAADYIGTIRLDSRARAMTGYQARSLVLNKALQYLSWPARVRPIDHMEHNWAAQRHLLRLAATVEPPLVMDQNGYRAVRAVLIALGKTRGEAKNADRAARTWPPYRRTLDGIDERRDPEDDLSRSAKAGILVREAGYNDDVVDRALSALGGSTFGQSPTIPTRSLVPPFFSGRRASLNVYLEWAAQIRATRNPREAWMMFEHPPEPNIRPTAQVYGEMFEKLYARPATESSVIRPGDAKEVFPVHNGNLSEFEIARLTPPTPDELYDKMLLQDKVKPTGHCLAVLVRNAPSRMAALRYLSDSPYEPYIKGLRVPARDVDKENLRALAKLPPSIFNAWIAMLCRLHTRAPRQSSLVSDPVHKGAVPDPTTPAGPVAPAEGDLWAREASQGGLIPEAIMLASLVQSQNRAAARRDRLPWQTIMKALAGPKVLYSHMGAEFNVLETLRTFLDVYERTAESKGPDPVAFEALCVMIRKALKLATFAQSIGGEMVPRQSVAASGLLEQQLLKAHRLAIETFAQLTSPVPDRFVGCDDEGQEVGFEGDASRAQRKQLQRQQEEEEGGEQLPLEAQDEDGVAAASPGDELVDDAEHDGVTAGMLRYNVVGRPVYRYMLALACCGDDGEMVRVMDWLLDGWDREYVREEARAEHSLDYHYTIRTMAYFAEAGQRLVDPAEAGRLRRRLERLRAERGCTWFWPDSDGDDDDGNGNGDNWREGPARPVRSALPELETDLVVFERWTRLRRMVKSSRPDHKPASATVSASEPGRPLPPSLDSENMEDQGAQEAWMQQELGQGRDRGRQVAGSAPWFCKTVEC